MSRKQLRDEMMYQATMSMARHMLEEGIITREEYERLNRIFLAKYRPIIGSISSGAC